MKLTALRTLLVQELKDLSSMEGQFVKLLPKLFKSASGEALKEVLHEALEACHQQILRFDRVFAELETAPKSKKSPLMELLLEGCKASLELDGDPEVRDTALIAAVQKIAHHQISGYGTVRTWASLLNLPEIEALLQETLDEERDLDEALTELSETVLTLDVTEEPAPEPKKLRNAKSRSPVNKGRNPK
jgi:ferritin-like metal-binding protein YciE